MSVQQLSSVVPVEIPDVDSKSNTNVSDKKSRLVSQSTTVDENIDEVCDDESNDSMPLLHDTTTNSTLTVHNSEVSKAQRVRGLVYIVIGALNLSFMAACVKYSTHYITSHEVLFWRCTLSSILNYGLVRYNNVDLKVPVRLRRILLFRCFVGTVCVSLQYYAMSKMILTDAIVIIFTSPVFTFLFGALFLGEAVERIDFACALLSYLGVFFVVRPAMLFPVDALDLSKETNTTAVICALGAAITQATAYISMRKLHDLNYMTISLFFSLFGVGFSILMLLIFKVSPAIPSQISVQLALCAGACFSCIGLLFITHGFQIEKAGIASVMRYFDVVFVFILDITFLGETVHAYSVLGGCIISVGAIIIALRKSRGQSEKK